MSCARVLPRNILCPSAQLVCASQEKFCFRIYRCSGTKILSFFQMGHREHWDCSNSSHCAYHPPQQQAGAVATKTMLLSTFPLRLFWIAIGGALASDRIGLNSAIYSRLFRTKKLFQKGSTFFGENYSELVRTTFCTSKRVKRIRFPVLRSL